MPNPLFNRYGNTNRNNNISSNILSQYSQVMNDPGKILDIMLQNGKINQQQYNDLQPFRNNPKQIVEYLIQHGNANQINQAQNIAMQN